MPTHLSLHSTEAFSFAFRQLSSRWLYNEFPSEWNSKKRGMVLKANYSAKQTKTVETIYVRLSSRWPSRSLPWGQEPCQGNINPMKARDWGTNKNVIVIVFLSLPKILLCIHCQPWPQNLLQPCIEGAEQSVRMDIKRNIWNWYAEESTGECVREREGEREDTWQSLRTTRSWSWTLLQITDPWIEQPSPIVTWFITTELTTCIQRGMRTSIIGQPSTTA